MLLAQALPDARINVLPPHSSSSSIKKMYFHLCVGVRVHGCTHEEGACGGQKRLLDPIELGLLIVVDHLI